MSTSIQAEPGTIVARAGGPATGNVWLVLAGHAFPAAHWDDFIVVVLGGWAAALLRLVRKVSERELPFAL